MYVHMYMYNMYMNMIVYIYMCMQMCMYTPTLLCTVCSFQSPPFRCVYTPCAESLCHLVLRYHRVALGKQFLWLCCGLVSMAFHWPGLGQQHGRSSLTPGLEEGVEEGIEFVILFCEKGRSGKSGFDDFAHKTVWNSKFAKPKGCVLKSRSGLGKGSIGIVTERVVSWCASSWPAGISWCCEHRHVAPVLRVCCCGSPGVLALMGG